MPDTRRPQLGGRGPAGTQGGVPRQPDPRLGGRGPEGTQGGVPRKRTFEPIPTNRQQVALDLVRKANGALVQPRGGVDQGTFSHQLRPSALAGTTTPTVSPNPAGPRPLDIGQEGPPVGPPAGAVQTLRTPSGGWNDWRDFQGLGQLSQMMQQKREQLAAQAQGRMGGGGGVPMTGIPPGGGGIAPQGPPTWPGPQGTAGGQFANLPQVLQQLIAMLSRFQPGFGQGLGGGIGQAGV
jgi:hypothetical protein